MEHLADIVTSIIEIKELINEKVSALSSRIDNMEKNKDKEIENLKFKLSEKEEQNKMLEAQLNRHLTNEQRIVSENKILKSDCKELETKLCSSQSEHRLISDQFRKLDVIVGKVDTILLRTKPSYASLLSADRNSSKTQISGLTTWIRTPHLRELSLICQLIKNARL